MSNETLAGNDIHLFWMLNEFVWSASWDETKKIIVWIRWGKFLRFILGNLSIKVFLHENYISDVTF